MVKIVGHRGAAGYAPENTLLSFQRAIDIGCDRTELDVRLSKNGELVVIHDANVSRVTDGKGMVAGMTLEKLKELHCSDNQKLPTLQEVVDLCKGKISLQIELKVAETPRAVLQVLVENGIGDDVVITSFDTGLLTEMKSLNPALQVGLLFDRVPNGLWGLVEKIPLDFIGAKYTCVTTELVDRAHALGVKVYAYHVDRKDVGDRLIALGVNEIGTDFPKLFLDR